MLMCDKTLTLVQHIKEKNGDTYVCTPIPGCSWYSKLKVELQGKGLEAARITRIRIPVLPPDITLHTGDFLVNGVVAEVSRPAELSDTEYITILDIGDNQRGRFPHWAVVGE